MPEHPCDDWLTTATKRSGLDNEPVGMRSRIGVGEAANLPLLIIQQPADTLLRCMAINKWAVLVWHGSTMASKAPHRGDLITPILIDFGVGDH